jgi:osmotically-inducible protein OsmY
VKTKNMSSGVSRRVAVSAENLLQERLVLASRQIACEYDEGTLILRGQLSSFYEKQLAQEFARTLAGVDQVVNKIEVVATI